MTYITKIISICLWNYSSFFFSLPGPQRYTYIDVFNKGKFRNEHECTEVLAMPYPAALAQDSFQTIPYNKVC